jgi:hypothetical protein
MANNNPHRVFVVRKLPLSIPLLIEYVRAILAAMAGNAHFPTPTPPLATLTTSVNGLESAQATTKTRAPGSVAARDTAHKQVTDQVHQLFGYIQQIADANPEQAAEIIASAGIKSRTNVPPTKPPFAVNPGPVSGSARLAMKAAGGRAAYDWEYSLDGGKTWVAATTTVQAKTVISGLPVATSVMFRARAVIKGGAADWGQPITLVVK